ncbi:MAG: Na+/H+ antiporter subunit E [Alphaproteobacteria bacterium]|nr:Na+/H+ antiporter subunit E [Alphaproteobacteria bacterium]
MTLFLLNLLLALVWMGVTGVGTFVNLVFGLLIGFAALWLTRELWGDTRYFRRLPLVARLLLLFLYELVLSSLRVARDVLKPRMTFRPGIVAVPIDLTDDLQITMLANLITLTPGTMSVDVSDDRKLIYVHAMDIGDRDQLVRDIKDGFETRIREALG